MVKTSTKLLSLWIPLAIGAPASAQWCPVNSALPYSADMPGITNVTLNTINRTSMPIENYPGNSYVMTGVTTSLSAGQTYSVSVTHTRDAVIFPSARNNIRVWIDYNLDYSFDDAGETVVSLDYQNYGTSTASFTVPATVNTLATRMRITAKMSSDAGHSLPTPCDNPPDPLGYHGEVEDYNIDLVSTVGVDGPTEVMHSFSLYPVPASDRVFFEMFLNATEDVIVSLYNTAGHKIYDQSAASVSSGRHRMEISLQNIQIKPGFYYAQCTAGNASFVKKLIVY